MRRERERRKMKFISSKMFSNKRIDFSYYYSPSLQHTHTHTHTHLRGTACIVGGSDDVIAPSLPMGLFAEKE